MTFRPSLSLPGAVLASMAMLALGCAKPAYSPKTPPSQVGQGVGLRLVVSDERIGMAQRGRTPDSVGWRMGNNHDPLAVVESGFRDVLRRRGYLLDYRSEVELVVGIQEYAVNWGSMDLSPAHANVALAVAVQHKGTSVVSRRFAGTADVETEASDFVSLNAREKTGARALSSALSSAIERVIDARSIAEALRDPESAARSNAATP